MFSSILARGAGSNTSAYLHTNKILHKFYIFNKTRRNTHRFMENEHGIKRNKDEDTPSPSSHYVYFLFSKGFFDVFSFFMYFFQHCFICRPSDSTPTEDDGIESRTVATLALTAIRSDHSSTNCLTSQRLCSALLKQKPQYQLCMNAKRN